MWSLLSIFILSIEFIFWDGCVVMCGSRDCGVVNTTLGICGVLKPNFLRTMCRRTLRVRFRHLNVPCRQRGRLGVCCSNVRLGRACETSFIYCSGVVVRLGTISYLSSSRHSRVCGCLETARLGLNVLVGFKRAKKLR